VEAGRKAETSGVAHRRLLLVGTLVPLGLKNWTMSCWRATAEEFKQLEDAYETEAIQTANKKQGGSWRLCNKLRLWYV